MATGVFASTATFLATLVTKEDFPTPGRAATTMRFPGWRPWSRPSRSVKPVGRPAKGASRSCSRSRVSIESWTRSLRAITSSLPPWRATA